MSVRFAALLVGLSGLAVSAAAHAGPTPAQRKAVYEAAGACQNVVRFDDKNVYLGGSGDAAASSMTYPRPKNPGRFIMIPLDNLQGRTTFSTRDEVVDFASVNGTLYVLTRSEIEEWSLGQAGRPTFVAAYPTQNIGRTQAYREFANGMTVHQNRELIISHGRLGVSVFDLAQKKIVAMTALVPNQPAREPSQSATPRESQATGIAAISNDLALISMDSFSNSTDGLPAFSGLVIYNMATRAVERRLGGMDFGSEWVAVQGNSVLVGFYYGIARYDLQAVRAGRLEQTTLAESFPDDGKQSGLPFVDETSIYTCFQTPPRPIPPPSAPMRDRLYRRAPKALNRAQFLLD